MKNKLSFIILALFMLSSIITGCKKNDNTLSPSQTLASIAWETTGAKDKEGEDVELTDENVINFVGYAYYNMDGSFRMYNLDNSPKLQGDWSVSEDGKTRSITAKNDDGSVIFTGDVEITVLTKDEFTYRRYPDNNDKTVYYDIIHTPTTHKF